MNLPNKLTLIRVLLIPIFVVVLLVPLGISWQNWLALAIFAIASLTDFADGYLARKYQLITNFGKFMDPLADKLLVCSALVCLTSLGRIAVWMVIVIVAREFIISGLRLVAVDQGVVIAASYWGKFKTVAQMTMIMLLLANLTSLAILTTIITWLALILTVVSLIDYIAKNAHLINDAI